MWLLNWRENCVPNTQHTSSHELNVGLLLCVYGMWYTTPEWRSWVRDEHEMRWRWWHRIHKSSWVFNFHSFPSLLLLAPKSRLFFHSSATWHSLCCSTSQVKAGGAMRWWKFFVARCERTSKFEERSLHRRVQKSQQDFSIKSIYYNLFSQKIKS